ncbi:exonuclease domain-containing protein [Streptomyces albus]|uniref:exonuclease domain-containing protein n=1 Tax=Streptomyces albus TaxID=1888 RepID=UPI0036FB9F0A
MTTSVPKSDSLPVYERRDIPADQQHLLTMTELKSQRLKPAPGQEPVAFVRVYRRGHGWGNFPLYDPAAAAKMRPLSAKQQAAKTARRTCPKCGSVRDHIVYGRCGPCQVQEQEERQALQARTCWKCRRVSLAPFRRGQEEQDRCTPCWVLWQLQKQFEAERLAVWRRTCPGRDCNAVTATDDEIAAVRADPANRVGWVPRWCPPCAERDARERAEQQRAREESQRQAEEHRRRRVAELVDWAQTLVDDPTVVVLDSETTGLEEDARIVDLAVYSMGGDVLLDTLIDPGMPIPAESTDIHGITNQMTTGAPSFTDVLPRLTEVLEGRRCLIYNKSFDVGRLRHELTVHHQQAGVSDPAAAAAAWISRQHFEDVMLPYSEWFGDWSDFWGNYAWQPLYGGDHRALSDCRAVVDLLKGMARQVHAEAV